MPNCIIQLIFSDMQWQFPPLSNRSTVIFLNKRKQVILLLGSYDFRCHIHAKDECMSLDVQADTHSESLVVLQLGGEKLGICGRLTLGTVRFGTLGIWRLTLGRVLVLLLQTERITETENRVFTSNMKHVSSTN